MEKSTSELLESLKSSRNYDEFLSKEVNELNFASLSEYLNILIDSKGIKKADIILKSNLDKNYAYQIFNGTKNNPSRDKIIMLAFGIGLNLEETSVLLKNAKHPDLYVRDPRDSIIIFCISNSKSLIETNVLLDEHSLPILE